MRIRFDESPVLFGSDFQTPTQIITVTTLAELAPASERLEAAQRSGHWLAGYASYELGYSFESRPCARMPTSQRLPLLQFGAFIQHQGLPDILLRSPELFFRTNLKGQIQSRPNKRHPAACERPRGSSGKP